MIELLKDDKKALEIYLKEWVKKISKTIRIKHIEFDDV